MAENKLGNGRGVIKTVGMMVAALLEVKLKIEVCGKAGFFKQNSVFTVRNDFVAVACNHNNGNAACPNGFYIRYSKAACLSQEA